MAVERSLRKAIEAGRFDEVEDAWLQRLEEDPEDLDFYAGVARRLAANGGEQRARTLLELVGGELEGSDRWERYLELLRAAGALLLDPEPLHAELVATLRRLHDGSPSFDGLAEKVGLFRAIDDLPKIWTKVDRLRALLAFEVGSAVWMRGKGGGRVVEVNLELESFRVDFDRHPGLTVGFGGAAKLMKAVPPGHVVQRRLDEPEALRALAKKDPPALLQLVLASYDRPLTAGEVREALGDLIPDSAWSAWWGAARRHPQVVTEGKGSRQRYRWAESAGDAVESARTTFAGADLSAQLTLYRREAGREVALRDEMESVLAGLAAAAARAGRPGDALAVWAELDRAGRAPDDVDWSPQRLVASAAHPADVVLAADDRALRQKLIGLVRRERDDWVAAWAELLRREEDPRLLDLLLETLEREHPAEADAFVGRVLSQPRKAPAALVWLGERQAKRVATSPRRAARLFQHLLTATRFDEFAPFRPRLGRMFEAGGPFPTLIAGLDDAGAARAAEAVERAPFEAGLRRPLLDALHLRFPALRPDEAGNRLYALPASIAAKRDELRRLLEEEIPTNRKAIEVARELGDLRENFEYKSARQRHEYLTARSEALHRDLERAQPIRPPDAADVAVRIGSRVALEGAGDELELTILGPWESDPDRRILSYESEIAQRVIGCKPGDAVELPEGTYTVRAVAPAALE